MQSVTNGNTNYFYLSHFVTHLILKTYIGHHSSYNDPDLLLKDLTVMHDLDCEFESSSFFFSCLLREARPSRGTQANKDEAQTQCWCTGYIKLIGCYSLE